MTETCAARACPSIHRKRDGITTWEAANPALLFPISLDPNVVWATCYGDEVTRWDARTKQARSVSPYLHTLDSPPNDIKYRCHWTAPLAIDPFDHNTVYYGCQVIFKTTNGGQSWAVISPDLSTQDPAALFLREGLSATIWGSSTEKSFSQSRPPKFRRDSSGQALTTVKSGIRKTAPPLGRTSPRIFPDCLPGEPSPALRLRLLKPAPPMSRSIFISWITAIPSSIRRRILARLGSRSAAIFRSTRWRM